MADIVTVAEQVTGRPVGMRHAPAKHEPPVLLADNARIQEELGRTPKSSDLTKILTYA